MTLASNRRRANAASKPGREERLRRMAVRIIARRAVRVAVGGAPWKEIPSWPFFAQRHPTIATAADGVARPGYDDADARLLAGATS